MFYSTSIKLPTGTTQIATLPEEFCPIFEVSMNFIVPQSTNTVQINLKPTGEVFAYNYTSNTSTTLNIRSLLTYLSK